MNAVFAPLSSEFLKQKRTATFWFILLAPLSMSFLYFLVFNRMGAQLMEAENVWAQMLKMAFSPINALMLPLFVAVMTSLVHFVDHKNNSWKHLYALPVNKSSVFLSKSVFSFLMVVFTLMAYPLLVVATGYLLSFVNPEMADLRGQSWMAIIWESGFLTGLKSLSAVLGIWALHNWLGYRLKSFAMPVGVGLLGVITHMVMMMGGVEEIKYFPYSFTALSERLPDSVPLHESPMVLGAVLGVAIFSASMVDASRRDVE